MQYTNEFPDSAPTVHEHQTINPQFLNTPQQANNQHAPLNNFIYVNPPSFERQDNQRWVPISKSLVPLYFQLHLLTLFFRTFDYFRNDLQMPSILNRPTANSPSVPATQTPGVEVVMPANRTFLDLALLNLADSIRPATTPTKHIGKTREETDHVEKGNKEVRV